MTDTKPEPWLSDAELGLVKDMYTLEEVRDIYKAARAKNAELIQMLVDALQFERESLVSCLESMKALQAAAAAGFKPSND